MYYELITSMEKHGTTILYLFLTILSICYSEIDAGGSQQHGSSTHVAHSDFKKRLFVFGDSYADTGNWPKSAWIEPYGISFPGKPSGRFSDGLVLTDYVASFLGVRSPTPYEWIKKNGGKSSPSSSSAAAGRGGMNFAYGGTGVFDTLVNQPKMSAQINFFKEVVEQGVYSRDEVRSSVALVSLAGNDYDAYWVRNVNSTLKGLPAFSKSVIKQLVLNLKRIRELGVMKVAVTTMGPSGCLPRWTSSLSYQKCSDPENSLAKFHNKLLRQGVSSLNLNNKSSSRSDSKNPPKTYQILDLYEAFMASLKIKHDNRPSYKNALEPCCLGTSSEYTCGSTDMNGAKRYVVCQSPNKSFFWDTFHPSSHGWFLICSSFNSSLRTL